jgi:hypothetical protein
LLPTLSTAAGELYSELGLAAGVDSTKTAMAKSDVKADRSSEYQRINPMDMNQRCKFPHLFGWHLGTGNSDGLCNNI